MMILGAAAAALVEPVLDGRCNDHVEIAHTLAAPGGTTVYVRQTRDYVWLCFGVPEGSYATLDLRIEAPAIATPLNLHASAQLGEWPADDPAAVPEGANSARWWHVDGWWGSTTPFNGLVGTADGRRAKFRTVSGREVQLSKRRFGFGDWRVAATLSNVAASGGGQGTVRWPESGMFILRVNQPAGPISSGRAPASQ